jgi:hypothetical protein
MPPDNNKRRVSLFSLQFTCVVLAFISLLGIVFWRMGRVTEDEVKEYNQLIADAESSGATVQRTPYTARQDRQGVQKDLFFQRDNQRMHIRLSAAKAQLVLDHQDLHSYVVEHMQNVDCYMQEELYYQLPDGREALLQPNGQLLLRSGDEKKEASWMPMDTPGLQPMQVIRYIQADQAEYHYKDDRFIAYLVKITRYAIPGHQLKEAKQNSKMLMKGTADQAEFCLKRKDKDLNFHAQNLKATFFDIGKMKL